MLYLTKQILFSVMTHWGLEFDYHGDWVIWLWPWRRKYNGKFISTSFGASFPTLKSINDLWEEYFEAQSNIKQGD